MLAAVFCGVFLVLSLLISFGSSHTKHQSKPMVKEFNVEIL